MSELIACRGCLQPNCEGCNINTLANMLFSGKFDCLIDEHHCVNPEAEFAPVVHGRWVQIKSWATKAKYRCSVCGREIMSANKVNMEKYTYCHCGAKMGADNG